MKSTQATIRQRVEEVLQIRLLGAEFPDIRQHAAQNQWDVSDRQLWRYVHESDAILAETLEKDREKLFNRHLAQRHALYARAVAAGDLSTARAVLKDEAELLGLYPPKRTELTGKDGGPLQTETVVLSDDERRTALAALFAQLGNRGHRPPLNGQGNLDGSALGGPGPDHDRNRTAAGPLADDAAFIDV
jgi:hypothetical protein